MEASISELLLAVGAPYNAALGASGLDLLALRPAAHQHAVWLDLINRTRVDVVSMPKPHTLRLRLRGFLASRASFSRLLVLAAVRDNLDLGSML